MAEQEYSVDFSKIAEKLVKNKKVIFFVLLALVLLFSAWVRLIPADQYYLSAMDPYWHYRHSAEIVDHGYPGTELREIDGKMVPWDSFHNAPYGGEASKEFYQYFTAYSYMYLGKFLVADLMTWTKLTPVFFGVLSVLFMYLLVAQLFGRGAGLGAAFMFSIAPSFLMRSVAGFADTDAPIAFFTILSFYLFLLAWDRESYLWGASAGLSMGLFAFTWGGYRFAPLFITAAVGFHLVSKITLAYVRKKNIIDELKTHRKKYTVFAVFLLSMFIFVTLFKGIELAKFWSATRVFSSLKEMQRESLDTGVRNVFLTVSEMSPGSLVEIVSRVHIISVFLFFGFLALLPFGLWKKLSGKFFHLSFFTIWLAATFYSSFTAVRFIEMFAIPLAIFSGIVIAEMISKISSKKPAISIFIVVTLIALIFFVPNYNLSGPSYFQTSISIASQSGPGVSGPWLDFYDWVKTETPKGAIFASWWDPGHALTALGERPAVADGSQNDEHVHDLALMFTSTDMDTSLSLMKEYNISYFFTSSDLLPKYSAISFLAGEPDYYPQVPLSQTSQQGDTVVLEYKLSQTEAVYVSLTGPFASATLQSGYNTVPIQRIIVFSSGQPVKFETEAENAVDYMIYVLPDYQSVFLLPPRLENNLLTRLHLFSGADVDGLEFVKDFGGTIKVFKVK
ncbi:TPA: glycosyltransferase family 39 protein [archaeon]|nr:glycosyltransferase family 39 protein [Candidatus Undinarchaeales archaeon SRR5007147.bin71]